MSEEVLKNINIYLDGLIANSYDSRETADKTYKNNLHGVYKDDILALCAKRDSTMLEFHLNELIKIKEVINALYAQNDRRVKEKIQGEGREEGTDEGSTGTVSNRVGDTSRRKKNGRSKKTTKSNEKG